MGLQIGKELDYEDWEEVTLVAYQCSFHVSSISYAGFKYLSRYSSVEESIKRIKDQSKHTEIYDNQEMNRKIEKGYTWLMKRFPKEFTK